MYRPVVCLLVTLCSTNLSAASLTPAAVQASAPLRQPELRGHVVDGTGSPVASAQITVRPEAGGAAATILADGRGDFALPLPAGVYRLTVSAAGFEETSTRVTVSAAQERVAVD